MAAFREFRTKLGLRKPRQDPALPNGVQVGHFTYGIAVSSFHKREFLDVRVGSFTSVGPDVFFNQMGDHSLQGISSFPLGSRFFGEFTPSEVVSKGPIIVGNDVWIGRRAIIMSGVTIGDGAIIGAGAIVTKDVPPFAVAVGNPAKVVKYRYSSETIAALLSIAWWDWPIEKINSEKASMLGSVEEFVDRHGQLGHITVGNSVHKAPTSI